MVPYAYMYHYYQKWKSVKRLCKNKWKQALCHLMMQPRCDKDSITPDAGLVSHSEGHL